MNRASYWVKDHMWECTPPLTNRESAQKERKKGVGPAASWMGEGHLAQASSTGERKTVRRGAETRVCAGRGGMEKIK